MLLSGMLLGDHEIPLWRGDADITMSSSDRAE